MAMARAKTSVNKPPARQAKPAKSATVKTAAKKTSISKPAKSQKPVARLAMTVHKALPKPETIKKTGKDTNLVSTSAGTNGNNHSLTVAERKKLKQLLIEERDRILQFLSNVDGNALHQRTGEGDRDRSSYSIHQADYASDNQSLNLALAQRQIESARLEEIEYALKRIDTKNYGKCMRCSCNIGFDRMQAKPYALYCITCRSQMEPTR